MRILIYLILILVSVSGFPEKRRMREPRKYLVQVKKTPRDCSNLSATKIAQKAAADAKAAHAAQNAAGAQAAHMVKTQLAGKAVQAAKAAEAALAGKQALVEQLQDVIKAIETDIVEDVEALKEQEESVSIAKQAAQYAIEQNKRMQQAVHFANLLKASILDLQNKTIISGNKKNRNLDEAVARLAHLQHDLQCACSDCAATKEAAQCACQSARAACEAARSASRNKRRKKHIHKRIVQKKKQQKT